MTQNTLNHYPVFGRKAPSQCGRQGDTANPFNAVTCPDCRARLEIKRDSHKAEAARAKPGSDAYRFNVGCADQWQAVLDAKRVSATAT